MAGRWTNDDIAWERFDAARLDPGLVAAVKAASLVERNAADYVTYLRGVFADDPVFCAAADQWGIEEQQHGKALARWAQLADPGFDFDAALKRFTTAFQLPLDATESVRGSRTGELIARCVVEVGTSSMYSAMRDATQEPVLKQIASKIAADEFRHYKLFHDHFQRYDGMQRLPLWRRLRIAVGRIAETSDDELSRAYWAANAWTQPYDRRRFAALYERSVMGLYRPGHVQRAVGMVLKACKLDPQGRLSNWIAQAAWRLLRRRQLRLERTLSHA